MEGSSWRDGRSRARIVMASSETELGLPFDTPPPYVPVDEEYAARPESLYSLGKHLEETMAIELVRWHPERTGVRAVHHRLTRHRDDSCCHAPSGS